MTPIDCQNVIMTVEGVTVKTRRHKTPYRGFATGGFARSHTPCSTDMELLTVKMKTDKVTHHIHHADPIAQAKTIKRESIIKYQSAPKTITSYQVTGLALELSRNADGTIDSNNFEANCDRAFEILIKLQSRIEEHNHHNDLEPPE